ncbi:glyoxylase-like metal-dependent hydrolase (beta-lactamase superfamily II) [Brevundimonas alba]|uniref:Glyoxylase-like metal-dependent hydrolase (Beta-lactamase superfamily II) n=1 Tax=Brevundimonas alba TaxID=74314 RepID=A0A7X5YK11_9CAUL|nr:MBL fold metallo-hydrolase [Brevundimonas alba]NJC40651.1 glyoxylase-like metal-dependent hydrolase (beta-lactamase superfamily II) [Brevundimonas alba]
MKIHHINCGTDCPFGGALMDGCSHGPLARLVCHCLLIETPSSGLVLVDTGYGLNDVRRPHPRTSRLMHGLLNIRFREEETARRQVEAMGYSARDVRHIVLTHLDFDHAGGLEDFPEAQVHLTAAELSAARRLDGGVTSRKRYRPMQLDGVRNWRDYEATGGDGWFGFEAVRDLAGLPPEILLIPLKGHTWGHAGVAVQGPDGWLLHAGDAYFFRDEVRRPERKCTPGLRLYQNLMEVDRGARLANQQRLRELSLDRSAGVRMICAHDPVEYERAAAGAPLV